MESSSSALTREDGIVYYVQCGIFLLSLVGFVLLVIGMTGDNNAMATAGFVLFFLPFICWGLGCIVLILGGILLGILAIARGMRGDGLVKVVPGLIITTLSLFVLIALVDIGLNCAVDMFPILIFSMAFVGFIIRLLCIIGATVKLVCIKRWGIILKATVHKRRRHCSKNDNGVVTYEHELLVTYDVEGSHQSCWRTYFRYQGVASSSSATEAVSTGDDEHEVVKCEESNGALPPIHILDEGSPVQPGLEQEKTDDNAIWSKRQCTQWLSVNESQYGSNVVEVSALPSWPKVAVTTDGLSQYKPWEHVTVIIVFTVFAAAFSMPGVIMPRAMFFEDGCCDSCSLWHVKASYILVSILLPSVVLFAVVLSKESEGSHVPNESSQELPIVRQSTLGSVATDDETATATASASDLYMEEDSLPSIT